MTTRTAPVVVCYRSPLTGRLFRHSSFTRYPRCSSARLGGFLLRLVSAVRGQSLVDAAGGVFLSGLGQRGGQLQPRDVHPLRGAWARGAQLLADFHDHGVAAGVWLQGQTPRRRPGGFRCWYHRWLSSRLRPPRRRDACQGALVHADAEFFANQLVVGLGRAPWPHRPWECDPERSVPSRARRNRPSVCTSAGTSASPPTSARARQISLRAATE